MLIDVVIFGETQFLSKILTYECFSKVKNKIKNREFYGCICDDKPHKNFLVNIADMSHKVVIKKISKRGIKGELTILKTKHGKILEDLISYTDVVFKPALSGGFNMWNDFYVKDIISIDVHCNKTDIKKIRIKKLNSIFGVGKLK
jgi:hypothetical protein